MRVPFLLFALVFVPAVAAQPELYMIHMQDYSFLPVPLNVPAGSNVTAMNFGPSKPDIPIEDQIHSVTAVDGSFNVEQIMPDAKPREFKAPTTPGTYPYYCVYHGDAQGNGMAGILIVDPAPASATPASGTPAKDDAKTPLGGALVVLGVIGAALVARRKR